MACEVAMLNHPVDVSGVPELYHQASWSQPLSPEMMSSPVHAQSPLGSVCSPVSSVHSPVLSHPNSSLGCCSPVTAHSPAVQAQSPIAATMHGSPLDAQIKQEQGLENADFRYSTDCIGGNSLSTLLRGGTMMNGHMGPPAPREILDGEFLCLQCVFVRTRVCKIVCIDS